MSDSAWSKPEYLLRCIDVGLLCLFNGALKWSIHVLFLRFECSNMIVKASNIITECGLASFEHSVLMQLFYILVNDTPKLLFGGEKCFIYKKPL